MFGYAKEDITKKISHKKGFLSLLKVKEKNFHNELRDIHSCIAGNRYVIRQKNNVVFFSILLGLSGIFLGNFGVSSIPSLVSLLVAGMSAIKIGFSGIRFFQVSRRLNQEYPNWKGFDLEELSKVESKLFDEEFEIKHQQIEITSEIRNLEQELDRLTRFENIHSDFEELKKDPYYASDTASEYESAIKEGALYDLLFEKFLEEHFLPEDVHLDTVLEEPISYTKKDQAPVKVYKF